MIQRCAPCRALPRPRSSSVRVPPFGSGRDDLLCAWASHGHLRMCVSIDRMEASFPSDVGILTGEMRKIRGEVMR